MSKCAKNQGMPVSNYNSLETYFEGNSRTLKLLPDQNLLLCRLKPTVFSLAAGGPVEAQGIDAARTELNALFSKELMKYGIKTSTLKTENGLILMSKEKVPPIEVVVKAALIGSPKHIYEGIGNTRTRNGLFLKYEGGHEPYVRFDWRNPLPKEDICMPEGLANYFIDVKQAEETALTAYERLRCYCLRCELDLQDICFFMNEAGDTICGEVSTDNVRLKYTGRDQGLLELINSRDQERATRRAQAVLSLLQTPPKLRYQKIILCGGFCTGKTSLIELLQKKIGIPKLIDHTTRNKRPHERDGFPYHFIFCGEFKKNRDADVYYEWVSFSGNYYGVPKKQLFETDFWSMDILSGSWRDYQGKVPGVLGIFLESPSKDIIIKRAQARGDSPKQIEERLLEAKKESPDGFDLIIPPNIALEDKYEIIRKFIQADEAKINLSEV